MAVRTSVLILRNKEKKINECWGALKAMCEQHDLPYHTLSRKKDFPIERDGWTIEKFEILGNK